MGATLWLAQEEWASKKKMKAESGHRASGTLEREQWSLKRNQGRQRRRGDRAVPEGDEF